jgi:hypothetical protein
MGSSLPQRPEQARAPTFMVMANRDPIGANLDRIQIVKGWADEDGITQEKVYDVVWSGSRKIGRDGKLAPVGNSVDVERAVWTNSIGAAELATTWVDHDFEKGQAAFYYARVIEIPTPRWTTYDAVRFGIDRPADSPATLQERAYSSPIWYNPPAKAGAG